MNLTVCSDYAFRTMMLLAVRDPQSTTIQEIADHYEISRGHLMVLVHRLGSQGFLENTRGRGGGIRLARPAAKIRLDEIVRATEPNFRMVECFDTENNRCLITKPCRLRRVLDEALKAWMGVLKKYTLADLVERNLALARMLVGPEAAGQAAARRKT